MSQPTLKSLLGKRTDLNAWLQSWNEKNSNGISILDDQKNLLFGKITDAPDTGSPIMLDDQVSGYVSGTADADIIARLLSIFLQKEAEKKKLGTEVLHVYQELNVIYN